MDSTVKQSLLWRSKLNHVDMFKSRVKGAVLTDCEGKKDKAVAAAADAKVEKLDYKVLQDESESEEEDESTASDEEAERPPPYAP